MNDCALNELRQQNRQLHQLLVSVSATLLRNVTEHEVHRPFGRADAERFVHEAEDCFRCARLPELKAEIAQGLEAAGRELMAMAVEIETRLQRLERRT